MNFEVLDKDNNFSNPLWLKCPRMDLNIIPRMFALGYSIMFDYRDKQFGRVTPDNCPHDAVSFKKGNFHTWKCYKNVENEKGERSLLTLWQTAYLVQGGYVNHLICEDIEAVIAREQENWQPEINNNL